MKNRHVKPGIVAMILIAALVCTGALVLRGQKQYVPDNKVSAMNMERSQVYVTGTGYKIDKGQKQLHKKIEKKKKEEAAKKSGSVSQNKKITTGEESGGKTGEITIDSNDSRDQQEVTAPTEEPAPETTPQEDLRPVITTNLYDGETVSGTYVSFYIIPRDRNQRHITADMVNVTCNGTRVTSTGDDNNKIAYRADLQDGTNSFTITATDKYGASRTITRSVRCNINGKPVKVGYVWMRVNARTVGLGDIVAKQKVELYKGDQLSYAFDRLMKNNGFTYGHSGSLSSGFYLANIRKTGITAGAKIPDKLKQYLDDVGWTQKDYHDNQLGDDDFTQHSGWMVSVNGSYPSQGMSAVTLSDGDEVVFEYTIWNGSDLNGTWDWEK